jgi:FKBP-type peptidyl-prolyl cis-trans isomerase 2
MTKHESQGSMLEPGQYVVLEGAADWGLGQVQSVAGDRVTVNFENAGKRVINVKNAELKPADPAGRESR